MDDPTADELQTARRPLDSLIGKSEKAVRKLASGTWQHAMLRNNLKALHIAVSLMDRGAGDAGDFPEDDLRAALDAFASMIRRTEQALPQFTPGTAQHSLLRDRLKALRIADALTKAALDRRIAQSRPRTT